MFKVSKVLQITLVSAVVCCAFSANSLATTKISNLKQTSDPSVIQQVNQKRLLSIDDIKAVSGTKHRVSIEFNNIGLRNKKRTWLRIIGLPQEVSFSRGNRISDIWFLSPSDLSDLTLISPAGFTKKFPLKFFIVQKSRSGVSIISKKEIVVELVASSKQFVKKKKPKKTTPKNKVSNVTSELGRKMLGKAQELLTVGDIMAARVSLRFAYSLGNAKAAYLLGTTFDSRHLQTYNAPGIKSDLTEAKKWYLRAQRLGSQEADNRIQEIELAGG